MAFYTVFKHPKYQIYFTTVFSKATVFHVLTVLMTVIIPLLVAYRSHGFWKKEDYYREQPIVNYKKELILYIQTPDNFYAWSSYPGLNQLIDKKIKVPFIKSREEDHNHDGKLDSLTLSLQFPIQKEDKINGIELVLIFSYQLYRYSYFKMEGLVHIQHLSSQVGSGLSVVGDLELVQKQPLGHKGRDLRYNDPIFDKNSVFAEDFDIYNILSTYSERNVSVKLGNMYSVWKPSYGGAEMFDIKIKVRYTEQLIRYTLGFWQLLKWAWIQYVAVLWIFIWIFKEVKTFVFKNQIIQTIALRQHTPHYHN